MTQTTPAQETTNSGSSNDTPSTQQDEAASVFYGDNSEVAESKTEGAVDDGEKTSDSVNSEDSVEPDSKPKDDETKADQEKDKTPDKYELKVSKESLLSNDQVKEIEAYARQQGFSNDQAQALLNREQKLLSAYKESLHTEFEATAKKWTEDLKSDKEIGVDNFSKSGRACTIVTLGNGEYLVERLVYNKHQKTEDEILSLTLVLTRAVKSSYDPTNSVTSQKSLYGPKTPLNHLLKRYA